MNLSKTNFLELSALLLLFVVSEGENEKEFDKGNLPLKEKCLEGLFIQNGKRISSNGKTKELDNLEGIGIEGQEERILIGKLIILLTKASRDSKDLLEIERFAILLTPDLRDYKDNILEEIQLGFFTQEKEINGVIKQVKTNAKDGDFEV